MKNLNIYIKKRLGGFIKTCLEIEIENLTIYHVDFIRYHLTNTKHDDFEMIIYVKTAKSHHMMYNNDMLSIDDIHKDLKEML